jgi:ABC-2 type transport system permease protein
MTGNSAFELRDERGWRRGLGNLMSAGFAAWWSTNLWWVQTLIWTGIINFILAGLLWGAEAFEPQEAPALFALFGGLFPPIAVTIIMQDAVVGEKLSGTAAWVLSKPVSRTAFILSKLIPSAVGAVLTMNVFPGVAAFLQFTLAGAAPNPLNYLLGLGVLAVNLLYFLTLTVMLGVLVNNRAAVIGVPLALAFGQQYLLGMIPPLRHVLPWTLVLPPPGSEGLGGAIAASIMAGQPLPSLTPLYAALLSIALFTCVAIWRFQDEEF